MILYIFLSKKKTKFTMNDKQENTQKIQSENQRLKQIVDELTILNDIANNISSTMEVQEIMAKIITKSITTIGVEQGTIMLVEKDTEKPLRTIIRGVDDENRGRIYQLGNHLSGYMVQYRKPLLINNTKSNERLQGLEIEQTGIHSLLSVPMILRGKLVGVINLFNKKDGAGFTENDERLMKVIATQVASFLMNAMTCEQIKESRDLLNKQTIHLQQEVGFRYGFEGIIGNSPQIKEIKEQLKSIAACPASVLIIGETGTGKELVAKIIHYNSDRKDQPFVDVNSAAIPETLVGSQFFGIEEGVATGVKKRIGLFEQANNGTLFIDEVGDMSLATQAKILRVLEEKQVRRVGSNQNINVDVRLIAATNKDIKEAIDNKSFREDLYYRLNVFEITLPPLRERKEDIPLLMEHFANKFADQMGKAIQGFSPEATEILINYEWPGNVRELANVVERAVILTKQPFIAVQHLPPDFKNELEPPLPATELLADAVNHFKKQVILKTIRECGNNKSEAARKLGISRVHLFKLLKQ